MDAQQDDTDYHEDEVVQQEGQSIQIDPEYNHDVDSGLGDDHESETISVRASIYEGVKEFGRSYQKCSFFARIRSSVSPWAGVVLIIA